MPQPDRRQILDPLSLLAGMVDELGIAIVIDQATQQNHERCIVTVCHAVKAMVLNRLGFVNQQLFLVPRCFHTKPTQRLLAQGCAARHLDDDTLYRALETF